jgi:hypothetical protein
MSISKKNKNKAPGSLGSKAIFQYVALLAQHLGSATVCAFLLPCDFVVGAELR